MVMFRKMAWGALLWTTIVATACSSNQNTSIGGSISNEGNKDKAAPMTITIMTPLHEAETPDARIEKILEEKLNVQLEIQWIPATTYVDRMKSALATGSLTDIVNISMQGANKEAIRDGQFWEIGAYLDKFDNLKKLNKDILKNTMVNGKLYALYQGIPHSRQGLIYRKDWADKLGLSEPSTIDEYYEMLKKFTENDPDGNGKDDTIGLSDRADLNYGAFKTIASWFGTPNEWGIQDGKLMPAFTFPQYKETMDFFKKLRDNGYINQDYPVTSKSEQQNIIKNGIGGSYIGCMCDVQGIYKDAVRLNPNAVFDVHNKVNGPNGDFAVWSTPGFNHPYLFPKSAVKTEEELLGILEFFNGMMNPEIANLVYWGIEGEHYNVKDGKAVPIGDQGKIDREVKPYNTIEIGEPDTNGRWVGMYEYKPREKAEKLNKDNNSYLVLDPTVALDSETFTQKKDVLAQIIIDATYKYMLGDIDEAGFNQAIKRWMSEGGDKVIEEFNEELNIEIRRP
jgi:putative aldouronate transport system substrate-binding protein